MANVLEDVGRSTLNELDYVGSLNIQLWSTSDREPLPSTHAEPLQAADMSNDCGCGGTIFVIVFAFTRLGA